MMPTHADAYEVAARYAVPQWGGSNEEVLAVIARARRADVDPDRVAYIEDHSLVRPWNTPTPGAEKIYWEKVIARRVTQQRLDDFAMYYLRLSNWRDAMPLLERAIREHPHVASSYYWRARSHDELGESQAALPDYRLAAAMGDEHAIEVLIRAHIQGRLGLPARNFAARGGHANSQHDIGWLMMSGRGGGMDAATAKAAGEFWLQRSAEQGHEFAARKLQDAGVAIDQPGRRAGLR